MRSERRGSSDLRSYFGNEYLVIAPRALAGVVEGLVERRRGQGLSARVVVLEEVYELSGPSRP